MSFIWNIFLLDILGLIKLKQSPDLLNSISNIAFQYARDNFGINKFNESYKQVLKYWIVETPQLYNHYL